MHFDYSAAPFGYKFSTINKKILQAVHDSRKQFKNVDSKHEMVHILVYTSAHFQLNYNNFIEAIKGYGADFNGKKIYDLRSTKVFKNTKEMIKDIDLYMWLQISHDKKFYQASYFPNKKSSHIESVYDLLANLRKKSVSTMNMDNFESIQEIIGNSES